MKCMKNISVMIKTERRLFSFINKKVDDYAKTEERCAPVFPTHGERNI